MGNSWFESVAEARRRAERILPWPVRDALIAGSEAGLTLDANRSAFDLLGFAPVIAGKPGERNLATELLGVPLSMPVVISPTGVQAVHPDGEGARASAWMRTSPSGRRCAAAATMDLLFSSLEIRINVIVNCL